MSSIPNSDAYFIALGRFAHYYASLEIAVQAILWVHVRTDVFVARAIFNGTRVNDAIGRIKRIREVTAEPMDSPESKLLEYVFQQIAQITKARDDVFHYGAWAGPDGELTVTNWARAHVQDAIQGFKISVEVLEGLTADIERCSEILVVFCTTKARRIQLSATDIPAEWLKPWRYKSTEQAIHRKPRHGKPPAPKLPP